MSVPPRRGADGRGLEYRVGDVHAPDNPFGGRQLTIEPDGTARFVHLRPGSERAWAGRIDEGVLERLWAAIDRSSFPAQPSQRVPPGGALRTLIVDDGGNRAGVYVAWHGIEQLAGYDEAFPILDSLVEQMSEGTVGAVPDTLPPSVSELRPA